MIQTIALGKLVPSKRNVRRRSDAAADAQLRADIEARGLLQNLIVTANKKPRGTYAVEAGDAVFAPRMKALLLRAVVLARRRHGLAPSTRREYRRRLERALDAVMALAPTQRDGLRLRKRYGKVRSHLFTFLDHPEVPADNNGSERELRPTATYRKVTGGFRSEWGADLFAAVRSVIGTAARRGVGAYQAIQQILHGQTASYPG